MATSDLVKVFVLLRGYLKYVVICIFVSLRDDDSLLCIWQASNAAIIKKIYLDYNSSYYTNFYIATLDIHYTVTYLRRNVVLSHLLPYTSSFIIHWGAF